MKLTEEQLLQNWNDLMLVIDKKFEGERKDKLTEMYTYFRDRMMFAPACCGKKWVQIVVDILWRS